MKDFSTLLNLIMFVVYYFFNEPRFVEENIENITVLENGDKIYYIDSCKAVLGKEKNLYLLLTSKEMSYFLEKYFLTNYEKKYIVTII